MLSENTSFNYTEFNQASTNAGELNFCPPVGAERQMVISEAVKADRVVMKHQITWRSKGDDFFTLEQSVGEEFFFNYHAAMRFKDSEVWDTRTPILHPAVAGLDYTEAGFDEAYTRALANLDILMSGRREDHSLITRSMLRRYAKGAYNPYRLLVRGAALWAELTIRSLQGEAAVDWSVSGGLDQPRHIGSINDYASACRGMTNRPGDVLYVRCDNTEDMFMVDVMQALASDAFPIRSRNSVRMFWPPLVRPRVMYNSIAPLLTPGSTLSADDVYDTMVRYCAIHDCHDLWRDALMTVQAFVARPRASGVLAGGDQIEMALPPSNLAACILGPLFAGLTPEGMKTEHFLAPDAKQYLYGGAVRGVFASASYFEQVRATADAHPVLLETGIVSHRHFRILSDVGMARQFWERKVTPVAAAAGWHCITKGLGGACLYIGKDSVKQVFNASRVPWWSNVLPHLTNGGLDFLSSWVAPATLNKLPNSGVWYPFHCVGLVTAEQLAAAVRWTDAKVQFLVDTVNFHRTRVNVSTGTHNRFLPSLAPDVQIKGGYARAAIQFGPDIARSSELLRKLGKCTVEVTHMFNTDDAEWQHFGHEFPPQQAERSIISELEVQGGSHRPQSGQGRVVGKPATEGTLDSEVLDAINVLQPLGLDIQGAYLAHPVTSDLSANDQLAVNAQANTIARFKPRQVFAEYLGKGCDDFVLNAANSLGLLARRAALFMEPGNHSEKELYKVASESFQVAREVERVSRKAADPAVIEANLAEVKSTVTGPIATSLEEALRQGLSPTLDETGSVKQAPDDSEGMTETVEDFGRGASGPSSLPQEAPAASVESATTSVESIGFLPPAGSAN
nr:hypothetical protein [Umbelopsis ramanniana virus 6a]